MSIYGDEIGKRGIRVNSHYFSDTTYETGHHTSCSCRLQYTVCSQSQGVNVCPSELELKMFPWSQIETMGTIKIQLFKYSIHNDLFLKTGVSVCEHYISNCFSLLPV